MAEKKKNKEEEAVSIKGELMFRNVDPLTCRFEMEDTGKIQSNLRLNFVRDLLPADFEDELYEVKGAFAFKIMVIPKK